MLEFHYDNLFRIVEPHTFGLTKTGKDTLAAFQIDGESIRGSIPCWGKFYIEKILNLKISEDNFKGEREGYTRSDSRMIEIYCEL